MASTSKDVPTVTVHENEDALEPGACPESILNPTDSFEEFASEMSACLEERNILQGNAGTISEIQCEIGEGSKEIKTTKSNDDLQSKEVSHFVINLI